MKETDEHIEKTIDRLASSTRSPRGEFSAGTTRALLDKRIAAWRRRKYLRVASSVAAVVLLGVLSWGIYMAPAEILTISTLAETKAIRLPDGSEVMLNRYTSLSYPAAFKDKNREVTLQGGAYFTVSKDKTHPFVVKTGTVDVRVLGTEFNVEAYPKDEIVKTALFEGSVALDTEDHHPFILIPGETAIYDKTAKTLAKDTIPQSTDDIAWQDGDIVFKNLTLKEVARLLSNLFNVEIRIQHQELEQLKMTGRFIHNESLDDILRLLQKVGNFKVVNKEPSLYLITNINRPS